MRITSQSQAKHAYHNHHPKDQLVGGIDVVARQDHSNHAVTGQGMDGVEVSPDDLRAADQQLAMAQDELRSHMDAARGLHGPLGDGSGPVARHMRTAFLDRASADNGVLSALQNYYDELTNVRMAIGQTLATYEFVETGVTDEFNRQSEEQA